MALASNGPGSAKATAAMASRMRDFMLISSVAELWCVYVYCEEEMMAGGVDATRKRWFPTEGYCSYVPSLGLF